MSSRCWPWLCVCCAPDLPAKHDREILERIHPSIAPRRPRPENDQFQLQCCECWFPIFHDDLLNYRGDMDQSIWLADFTAMDADDNIRYKRHPPTSMETNTTNTTIGKRKVSVDTEGFRDSVRAASCATLAIVCALDVLTCGAPCGVCCYQGLGTAMLSCAVRWRIRRAYRIMGMGCVDGVCSCCCPGWVVEQHSSEMRSHGLHEPLSSVAML